MVNLEHHAYKGDSVAHSILIDLQEAINTDGVLTFRQRKFLQLWLEGYRQIDIAAMHSVTQKNVSVRINKAVKNISLYLIG